MIGVFDSGIGGLSVLKALQAELPHQQFIYVADNGYAPYGERDEAHIIARSQRITNWLLGQNIQILVIACNTATAAAITHLRLAYPVLPIIGVEPALKPAVSLSQTRRIGVMATRGTLSSAKFQALLAAQSGQADFVLQACDGLADAIERSTSTNNDANLLASCTQHTRAMGSFGNQPGAIDTLVLGCTHYPFAQAHLQRLIGPDVHIVSNSHAIARQTRRMLAAQSAGGNENQHHAPAVQLFTTGTATALNTAAERWLALPPTSGLLNF